MLRLVLVGFVLSDPMGVPLAWSSLRHRHNRCEGNRRFPHLQRPRLNTERRAFLSISNERAFGCRNLNVASFVRLTLVSQETGALLAFHAVVASQRSIYVGADSEDAL